MGQDAGEVKAKVTIEYDGKGVDEAKKDIASLAESAGGLETSANQAGEGLSGLNEQMVKSGESANDFSSSLEKLPKVIENGGTAVSEMTDALNEHQTAIDETESAYEALQKPLESTVSMLQEAAPSMEAVTKQAGAMQTQIAQSGDAWGVAGNNMQVFQEALASPEPFKIIDDHLNRTGQFLDEFTSSIGENNAQLFHEMSSDWAETSAWMDESGKSFVNVGDAAHEGFGSIATSAGEADKAVSEFLGNTGKSAKMLEPIGFGEAFGNATDGIMGALNDIAMPLMAVQMIGMAVQQVGQAIYDSAAIAEGAGAHSFGTFTGTVDALGQSVQRIGGQFSENFGQQLIPTLNALNYQASQTDLSGPGGGLGGATAFLANLWQIGTGFNVVGGVEGMANQFAQAFGMQQPFQGPPPEQQALINYQRQIAQMPQTVTGLTYQNSASSDQFLEMASNPGYLQSQDQLQVAQQVYQRAQQRYDILNHINPQQMLQQYQEQRYDQQQSANYASQMQNPTYAPLTPSSIGDYWTSPGTADWLIGPKVGDFSGIRGNIGGLFSGMGGGGSIFDGFSDWFHGIFGGGDGGASSANFNNAGCFVAGTHVLMSDGTSKAIETLQVDECVLAHDGIEQVTTTILALIKPPPKHVYKLTFEDGRTLILTNSHPVASIDGWKSLSPEATAQENPGLSVTALKIGDVIYTVDGACKLTSILPLQGVRQVYNITVDAPHTFYANNVLVHNKMGGMTNSGVGSEQISLSHTFTATVTWEANNLAKQFTGIASWAAQGLQNTFQGIANWVGQGLQNTFQGIANWVGSGLANTFQGIANWVGQGLQNTFQGIANWVGQGLQNTFQGIANWVGSGLSNTFQGVANWVGSGLENTFKGIASWIGSGLEHTFNAVANWTAQNLTPNFSVNPSFTMLAEGTSNWGGGPAIVGEAGPEVVEHNGQYSMFSNGAALLNLPAGANVYPMQNLATASVAQFADGTGNNIISIGGGGNMPNHITLQVQMMMPDGRLMAEHIIPNIAPLIRQQFQVRR
jgi:archaellum component FlaC